MAKEWAREFYNSSNWAKCERAYKKYRRGLCETCLAKGIYTAGVIVHHVVHLTPENISDPNVALNFDNLKLVCCACHCQEHPRTWMRKRRSKKRYYFNPDGTLYIPPNQKIE